MFYQHRETPILVRLMKRLQKIFLVLIFMLCAIPFVKGQLHSDTLHNGLMSVVLDAGHGGHDPGAMGPNSVEKEITLAIATKTGELIKKQIPEVNVIFTRTNDTFIPLHQRAAIANESAADLFVSIHCNSNPVARLRGAETYVMGLHKSAENLEVAKTENAAILAEEDYEDRYDGFDPDSDEDYIMLSMLQVANIQQSIDFSVLVQEKLSSVAGLKNRGVMQAGFVVLYLTTMPGVLIETGYLSNPEEEQFLLQKINQDKIAQAIAESIMEYHKKLQIAAIAQKASEVEPEPQDTFQEPLPVHIYRLWFTSSKKPISLSHQDFRNLPEIWTFENESGFHYTFEKAHSFEEINQKLADYRSAGKIKKRYLKNTKIVEIENDTIILVIEPDEQVNKFE